MTARDARQYSQPQRAALVLASGFVACGGLISIAVGVARRLGALVMC